MSSMRSKIFSLHLFAVTMVGSDENYAGKSPYDPAYLLVNGLYRFYGSLNISGMPDHVSIGKIHDEEIMVHNILQQSVSDFFCPHLRSFIVGFYVFQAGDMDSFLVGKNAFAQAVKEISDMRPLLCLGNTQLR